MENQSKKTLLSAKSLHFGYNGKNLLKSINLQLKEGEIVGIAGDSGSGKTTLLKLLAGLLDPIKGEIFFKNEELLGPKDVLIPGHPEIKLVHQDFDLMPYISVEENIIRNTLASSITKRKAILGHYKQSLKLGKVKNQKANETSGGQQQRVAMAAALASKPEVLLLDEPFSNLDFRLKNDLIQLLKNEWRPSSMIVVAHEPSDLLRLSDRLLVLQKGKIIQDGTPKDVYENPCNQYVAELLGPINVLNGQQAAMFGKNTDDMCLIRPEKFKLMEKGEISVKWIETNYAGNYSIANFLVEKWDKIILVQDDRDFISNKDKLFLGLK